MVRTTLACYRHHGANHTSRIVRAADNWRSYLHAADVINEYDAVDFEAFRAYVGWRCGQVIEWFRAAGDGEALAANEAFLANDLPMWRTDS